jgi:hypothetical protein
MTAEFGVKGRHAMTDRKDDLYETPACATRALIAAWPAMPMRIWEPACGRGAISRIIEASGRHVISTNLNDYQYGETGIDFLSTHEAPDGVQAIVTNPPYALAAEFVHHALTMVPEVAMLLRLGFLEGGQRCSKRKSVLDDRQLCDVLVFANRLPMMHRDGWTGPKTNSAMAMAWFIWRRGHDGTAAIRRIFHDRKD